MSDDLAAYQAIAKREKASRLEAERLLEEKSRALYVKNLELEKSTSELVSSNSLLTEIMAVAPDGILLCDGQYVICDANSASRKHLGAAVVDLIGRNVEDHLPGVASILAAGEGGEFFIKKIDAQRADGVTLPVEVRGFAGDIGNGVQYLIFFHDISRRIAAEEERRQAEQGVDEARRLEAIGALSAGIAHEINTPIQFIGDNLDYMKDGLKDIFECYVRYEGLRSAAAAKGLCPEEIKVIDEFNQSIDLIALIKEILEALQDSRGGIHQVRDIVLLMKEFAHPGSGARDKVDLNRIVRNVVMLSRNRQKGVVDVELDLAEDLPLAPCRQGQIQQVILNIFLNAIDAIDEANTGLGKVRITTTHTPSHVKVAISDTGPGVPDALKQKIFNPFFTTKPVGKGTGQGLALAKDCIVKGHDGRLSLADVAPFATTFLIELPVTDGSSRLNQERENAHVA